MENAQKELLSKRVFFSDENVKNKFFTKLKTQFGTWRALRKHFAFYKSKLERFRDGTVSLPYSLFLDLLSYLCKEDEGYFIKEITLKDKNWGQSKGGKSTYKKYRWIFDKGRKIGAVKAQYHFAFDTPLTPELCELIGAFIGDGFTNRYGNTYVVQYTGDANLDKEYYLNTLKPIIKKISPMSNPIITNIDNTLRLTINSKEFHEILTKRFEFKPGKKVYVVVIPDEIITFENKRCIKNCIRGIFDTDGSVYFDRRKTYREPYIRIELNMVSTNLIKQVYAFLLKEGIKARITKDWKKLQINGLENCKDFVQSIGFSNERHLDKIKHIL